MRPLGIHRTLALVVTLAVVAHPLVASAAVGDTTGDRFVGQPDGTTNTPNGTGVDASGLSYPSGAAFDASGNLFVADTGNSRVLGYRSPMTTDRVADIVIGQPDFNSNTENYNGVSASSLKQPNSVAVSPAGTLYVLDSQNNRVLGYDRPFDTDAVADLVFGQPDFESRVSDNGGVGAGSLSYPGGVAVDAAGNLWVADTLNHRVLEYDNPDVTRDRFADRVLGQPSFTEDLENNGGGVTARSLARPFSVAIDSRGNLWVADGRNHRVLEYDDPMRFDATADRLLGQPSLTSNEPNYTGQVSAACLRGPQSASVDANGNVYVCDYYNSRVLMYTSPIATNDRIADRVFGQPDFTSNTPNNGGLGPGSFVTPTDVAVDPSGNVAVVDYDNHRVVLLEAPTPVVTSIAVKVVPATGKRKLVIRGFGMVAGSAVVEVNGTPPRHDRPGFRQARPVGRTGDRDDRKPADRQP
jgi:sugar lactone lactonase YvrE